MQVAKVITKGGVQITHTFTATENDFLYAMHAAGDTITNDPQYDALRGQYGQQVMDLSQYGYVIVPPAQTPEDYKIMLSSTAIEYAATIPDPAAPENNDN